MDRLSLYLGVPVNDRYAWRSECRGPCLARRVGRYLHYGPDNMREWVARQPINSGRAHWTART